MLQCRVGYNFQRPTIKWFRKKKKLSKVLDDGFKESSINIGHFKQVNTYISDYFKYFENNFELIESAGEKEISSDTFLSKLIINNASKSEHEGVYACLGINYDGFKFKEVTVNVVLLDDVLDSRSSFFPSSRNFNEVVFVLIILILLALIPICLYTCYLLVCRKLSQNKIKKSKKLQNSLQNSYYQIFEDPERSLFRNPNTLH